MSELGGQIVPGLWYVDARKAIGWLESAFGFETALVVEDGEGGIVHSELVLGEGRIYVMGPPRGEAASPVALGGRHTQAVHVQLASGLDAHCERARAAGARIGREPETQAYGDRVYTCTDPEGHPWSFGQTVTSMSISEVSAATGHKVTTQL